MKTFYIFFVLHLTFFVNMSFANTAPQPWDSLSISSEISSKIFYHPIAHSFLTEIQIQESNEELVDLLDINNPRIIPLSLFDEQYKNTYEGWSKVRFGLYTKLLKMLEILPQNVGIAYFEGFRTLSKQKEYFDKKFLEILENISDRQEAYMETTKHVSPFINNIPTHCTGAAIDMTLFTIINGEKFLLNMGKFDVIFGPNDQQETFSANTNDSQRANRLLLLDSAIKSGLANYGFEWWHYSYGDKLHSFVYKKPHAIYGLADSRNSILDIKLDEYIEQIK